MSVPSQEDATVAGASQLIGGRWGRHAAGTSSWWWTPLRVALALTVLVTVLGYLQKSPCLTHPYSGEYQYTRVCYTDTYALYTAEQLNAKVARTGPQKGQVVGTTSVPYRDHPVEYPPVIGGLMWAAAEVTAGLHGGGADPSGTRATTFFDVTALLLALCALVSTWTIAKLAGRRRAWDAVMVGLSPVLLLHAFTNWDLAAVALTGLGLWAWSRGSPVWAGALLGVGIATKLYPVFVLLAIIMLCARASKWRDAGKAVGGAVAAIAVCYLPAILVSNSFPFPDSTCAARHPLSGWQFFETLSKTRGADWGSVWLVFEHVFGGDRFGRALAGSGACGSTPTTLNTVSAACVLVVIAGVGALVALAPRRPRIGQIAFLLVAGFIILNKVDSPQYALWLVPLAVLARPRWASLLIWQMSEVLLGVANLYTLINLDHSDQGLPINLYLSFVVFRDVILVGLIALVVREVMQPRLDVVRRDGVDDPAGGVLDNAPDADTWGRRAPEPSDRGSRRPATGHDGAVRRVGTVTAVSLLALVAGAGFAAVEGSAAASCSSTVRISGPHNGHLVLTPAAAKVQLGDCLGFTNTTTSGVNVVVTKDGVTVFSANLAHGATTSAKASYAPKTVGQASIAASSRVLLLKITGSGTATVTPAPTQSPTASSPPSPHGHHSSSPSHPSPRSPKPHKSKSHTPTPHATGIQLPPLPPLPTVGQSALPKGSSPLVAPGLTSLAPVTTTSSTPVAAVVAGPLETAEDTSRGLPIAVAVLVVLGLASGYGRVLLAAPKPAERHRDSAVDKRRDGEHRV